MFDSIRLAARAEDEYQTFADLAVVNGSSVDGVVGIADVLRRRREEFVRALERGAVVVVYAHPPALLTAVQGMPGLDRYFFLPAPTGLAWDATTVRGGEGTTLAIADHDHPLVRVLDLLRQDLLYRAYLDDRAPGFAAARPRVFARSAGGGVLGVDFPVLNGRVIFMPTPREVGAAWLVAAEGEATVEAMRELLRQPDEDRPRWVIDTDVPGLDALKRTADTTRIARERATGEEETAAAALASRAALRDVLWEGAEYRLLPAAIACAELLGFEVQEAGDGHTVLSAAEGELHVVAEGARGAVEMGPHYRLRRHLDELIERRAEPVRGLVVANGERLQQPEERAREYVDALRVAAEATGYALITSRWLFVAAVAALEGLPQETLAAIRRRLLETNGVVELTDLLVPDDADADAATTQVESTTEGAGD